jgi:hypothetical protein
MSMADKQYQGLPYAVLAANNQADFAVARLILDLNHIVWRGKGMALTLSISTRGGVRIGHVGPPTTETTCKSHKTNGLDTSQTFVTVYQLSTDPTEEVGSDDSRESVNSRVHARPACAFQCRHHYSRIADTNRRRALAEHRHLTGSYTLVGRVIAPCNVQSYKSNTRGFK